MSKICHLILCLFFLPQFVISSDYEWQNNSAYTHFEHLSIDDGLSQSTVYCITQDKSGFLWFCTDDGIDWYDGYQFRNLSEQKEEKSGLSYQTAYTAYADKDGKIWIGTYGGGVTLYDPVSAAFTYYTHENDDSTSLSDDYVYCIMQDTKGIIWIGTQNGLNRFNEDTGDFTRHLYSIKTDEYRKINIITSIVQTSEDIFWIGTGLGMFKFHRNKGVLDHFIHDPEKNSICSNSVQCVAADSYGSLWIGTANGLSRFDVSKEVFYSYLDSDKERKITGFNITAVYEDSRKDLWAGTRNNGLNRYDRNMDAFENILSSSHNTGSLNENGILSIFEDNSGVLWIGTAQGGLNKLALNKKPFYTIKPGPANATWKNGSAVFDFSETKTELVWIATTGGLHCFDPGSMRFLANEKQKYIARVLENKNIWCLLEDRHESLWIGTDKGLYRITKSNTLDVFTCTYSDSSTISDDYVICLYEDSEGSVWAGTAWGLNQYNAGSGTFRRIMSDESDTLSINSNTIWTIKEDLHGLLWVGTDIGLNMYDRETGVFKRFSEKQHGNGFRGRDVLSICVQRNGTVWSATTKGVNRYVPETNSFINYSVADGLVNDYVYSIEEDLNGNLWMGTNRGLSMFDIGRHSFVNFNKSDGLQSNEFNGDACMAGKDGMLYFGGIRGFNIFNPESIHPDTITPAVVLTGLYLFNRRVPMGMLSDGRTILKKSISYTDTVTLSYKDKVFSIAFAGLHYVEPEGNQYKYKMENFDTAWRDAGGNLTATYTNLNPGRYIFRVLASNSDGVWGGKSASLHILIKPPFYRTKLFYLSSTILFLFLVTALIRTSSRRIRKRNQDLKQRNTELNRLIRSLETAEDALRESEERFRNIAEKSQSGIVICDPESRILYCNDRLCAILGRDYKEVAQSDFTCFLTANSSEALMLVKGTIINDGYDCLPIILNRGDGKERHCTASSAVAEDRHGKQMVIVQINDITEKKEAEDALKQNERFFRGLIEHLTDVVLIVSPAGEITYESISQPRVLGYKPGFCTGRYLTDFAVPEEKENVKRFLAEAAKHKDAFIPMRIRLNKGDDSVRYFEGTIRNLIDDAAVAGLVITMRDITESHENQEMISKSLKEKEVMLKEIHHRVKNNLQVVNSLLSLAAKTITNPDLLDIFKDSRERIQSMALVHEKLYQSGDFSTIEFSDYTRSLVNSLIYANRLDFPVKVDIQAEEIHLGLDSAIPCGLIINELVVNVFKHAFSRSSKKEKRLNITIGHLKDGSIKLVVKDNGKGIKDKSLLRSGKSLGLNLVHILAEEQLSGTIECTNGPGACFTIIFTDMK